MGPKITEGNMQAEGNMPYYFLCDCQSNNKNILAKFMKTYRTFLKKRRKILKIDEHNKSNDTHTKWYIYIYIYIYICVCVCVYVAIIYI